MVSQMYGWIDTWMDRCKFVSLRYRFCGKSDWDGWCKFAIQEGWMDGWISVSLR